MPTDDVQILPETLVSCPKDPPRGPRRTPISLAGVHGVASHNTGTALPIALTHGYTAGILAGGALYLTAVLVTALTLNPHVDRQEAALR